MTTPSPESIEAGNRHRQEGLNLVEQVGSVLGGEAVGPARRLVETNDGPDGMLHLARAVVEGEADVPSAVLEEAWRLSHGFVPAELWPASEDGSYPWGAKCPAVLCRVDDVRTSLAERCILSQARLRQSSD